MAYRAGSIDTSHPVKSNQVQRIEHSFKSDSFEASKDFPVENQVCLMLKDPQRFYPSKPNPSSKGPNDWPAKFKSGGIKKVQSYMFTRQSHSRVREPKGARRMNGTHSAVAQYYTVDKPNQARFKEPSIALKPGSFKETKYLPAVRIKNFTRLKRST